MLISIVRTSFLALTQFLQCLCDTFLFYIKFKQSIPDASRYFRSRQGNRQDPVRTHILGLGRCKAIYWSARPDVAHAIFSSKGGAFLNRLGSEYGMRKLGMLEKGVIWNNSKEGWSTSRNLFQQAVQRPQALQEAVQSAVRAFHVTLDQARRAEDDSIDILAFFRLCTFRVTCNLALAIPEDALLFEQASEAVRRVTAYFKAWDFFSLQPQLLACLREALSVWTGRGGQEIFHEKAVLELFELSGQLLEEGRSHALSRDAKDPVGFFARNILERRENGTLSHEETNQLVLEMLIAGTDTSSVTLSWLPMAMQEDPSLEDALLCEVQQMLKQDEHTWGLQDLSSLPWISAALNESMRFKPVGPVVIRQATDNVTLPGGIQLQQWDAIILDLAASGQQPATFPQPKSFNAWENFMHNKKVILQAGQQQQQQQQQNVPNFTPFGMGRKGCVGFKLADTEMKVLLALFVKTFKITGCKVGGSKSLASVKTKWDIANQPTEDICIQAQRRDVTAVKASAGAASSSHPCKILRLCGAHGVGKTTLVNDLKEALPHMAVEVLGDGEVARSLMRQHEITQSMLTRDSATFEQLQHLIVGKQALLEQHCDDALNRAGLLVSDRCMVDPLAYTMWKFGESSCQYLSIKIKPDVQEALSRYRSLAASQIIVVPPFSSAASSENDNVRIVSGPQALSSLSTCMKSVLQHHKVPFYSLKSASRTQRVAEVLDVLDLQ